MDVANILEHYKIPLELYLRPAKFSNPGLVIEYMQYVLDLVTAIKYRQADKTVPYPFQLERVYLNLHSLHLGSAANGVYHLMKLHVPVDISISDLTWTPGPFDKACFLSVLARESVPCLHSLQVKRCDRNLLIALCSTMSSSLRKKLTIDKWIGPDDPVEYQIECAERLATAFFSTRSNHCLELLSIDNFFMTEDSLSKFSKIVRSSDGDYQQNGNSDSPDHLRFHENAMVQCSLDGNALSTEVSRRVLGRDPQRRAAQNKLIEFIVPGYELYRAMMDDVVLQKEPTRRIPRRHRLQSVFIHRMKEGTMASRFIRNVGGPFQVLRFVSHYEAPSTTGDIVIVFESCPHLTPLSVVSASWTTVDPIFRFYEFEGNLQSLELWNVRLPKEDLLHLFEALSSPYILIARKLSELMLAVIFWGDDRRGLDLQCGQKCQGMLETN